MRAPLAAVALLAGGLLAMPASVCAQSAPVNAALADRLALGRELAELTNSTEMTATQVTRMIRKALPQLFASDPDMQALEKDYPGLTKKLLDAAEPMLRDDVLRQLPRLWDRLGALYAERLTAAELREVIAFFSGGIKARMLAASDGGIDTSGLIQEAIESPEGTVREQSVLSTVTRGAKDVVAKLSPADREALARFGATPAGRHYNALVPESVSVATAWANEPNPETEAKLTKLMTDMVENATKMESRK